MKKIFAFILVLSLVSCAELVQVLETVAEVETSTPLTQTEIVKGLKEALSVGADTAVSRLSSLDGYYKDELVKIVLPDENPPTSTTDLEEN